MGSVSGKVKKLTAAMIFSAAAFITASPAAADAGTGRHTEGWIRNEENWYYYSESDNLRKGWLSSGDRWYYLDMETGAMQTGWKEVDGKWYYLNPVHGFASTGWKEIDGKYYYFNETYGHMMTGWTEVNGRWYYFNPVYGQMLTGWQTVDGGRYYLDPDSGRMLTGWRNLNDQWYYLDPSKGYAAMGWKEIDGRRYYFDPVNGRMMTGWTEVDGLWYYLNPVYGHARTGWMKQDGNWYYLDPGTGAMHTGWDMIDGKIYYFKETGVMLAADVFTVEGKKQGFAGTGEWLGEKTPAFLTAYAKAAKYVREYTNDSMTKVEKLRACFDIFRGFVEKNPWIPHYRGEGWVEKYVNDCLDRKSSNCIGYGASFAMMARVIGYDNVYACNSTGHGWCEINDEVYDPEWTLHRSGNYFGRPLVPGESQDYLHAIRREEGSPGHIKI